ncbi:MAG TPA: hypothetical protein VFI99_07625 [Nocardioides sp.]|nr:hypothetical protein [Nocardioides sp.]
MLHLGDRVVQDTSEATTTPQDAALNGNCGAPETNASVWYKYSPRVDRKVRVDGTDSGYSNGFLIFAGTPRAGSLVACGPGVVGLRARAGRTYNIMAISDTKVNGGRLVVSLKKAPPPPRVHVSIARRGVAFRGGAARIHGSYFCRHAEFAELGGTLFQRAGRLKIQDQFGKGMRCNGRRHHWSARLVSPVGTYARGHALARVRIIACGAFECRRDRARRHIHLAWAAGSPRQRSVQPSTTRAGRPRPLFERQRHWPGV